MTKVALYAIGIATTLESNKSFERKLLHNKWFSPVRGI